PRDLSALRARAAALCGWGFRLGLLGPFSLRFRLRARQLHAVRGCDRMEARSVASRRLRLRGPRLLHTLEPRMALYRLFARQRAPGRGQLALAISADRELRVGAGV